MSDNATAPVEGNDEASMYDAIKASIKEEVKAEVRADLKKELSRKSASIPAQPKEDDRDVNEFIRLVGIAALQDNRREKAMETLNNKYKAISTKTGEMVQGTTTAGGFLVPDEFNQSLFQLPDMPLALLPRVQRVPMATDKMYIPVLDQTVTPSNGSNAFNAGVALAAVSEANAASGNTKPAFKQVELAAIKLLAQSQLSVELVENSTPTATAIIQSALPKAINDYLEYQIINGSSLTGIVGHASVIKVPRDTSARIKLEDLAKMYGKFIGANPVWIFNKTCTYDLFTLEDANGNNVWLPNANVQGSVGSSLFGAPVIFSQYNPVLGSEGDVMLVDAGAYILGENRQTVISASVDFAFTSDLITYKVAWRGMGKPMITAPVKLADGTQTVSPFVVLDDSTS